MNRDEVKKQLVDISALFYQERIQEGMNGFMPLIENIVKIPELTEYINPLFDAVEKKDYVLVADIFYHEMAGRL
jgi:hypothetical protein